MIIELLIINIANGRKIPIMLSICFIQYHIFLIVLKNGVQNKNNSNNVFY